MAGSQSAKGWELRAATSLARLWQSPTINVIMTPEWVAVQTGILAALKPYPDARLAVAASLESHNGHAAGHA